MSSWHLSFSNPRFFSPARRPLTDLLPPLYLAYHNSLSEPTEVVHNNLRERFNNGEKNVVGAMKHFADIAAMGRESLLKRDVKRLSELIDENFDTRRGICNLASWQVNMVEAARRCGASAQFSGSGGAIFGIYRDEAMFRELQTQLAAIGSLVIKPRIC